MSSGVDVHRRPGIWSYFSFSSSSPRRRSISLPVNKHTEDRFEKPDRHSTYRNSGSAGFMQDFKNSMNQGQRTRYIKTGGIIAFIVLIFFFLAPRHSGSRGVTESGVAVTSPGAPTQKCTKSHDGKKPVVQYVLMIDAGSTGSRIHVYKFNNCGPTPDLEDEIFKTTPNKKSGSGLSSYDADAEGAANSLNILMDEAMKGVPEEYRSCTPVAVKATAGLRKLGKEKSEAILNAVRRHLEKDYPFPVLKDKKGGGVDVMEGTDEAVYAWVTTNFLLGKIGGPDKSPTAAVLDLGGGSTQIVFEPTFPGAPKGGMPETLAPGDHKYDLDFSGQKFNLYQHSYLGYGLKEARNNLHKLVYTTAKKAHEGATDDSWTKAVLNPCIAPGMNKSVDVEMTPGGEKHTVIMVGPKEGSPTQCRRLNEETLQKDAECKLQPCSFKGVFQPSFEKTFAREDVYLLSYFYDRMYPLGMPESFTIGELGDLADRVCHGSGSWDVFTSIDGAMKQLKERPDMCLDLTFMYTLLHSGYGMPVHREVKIAKKLKDRELGWALGASLPLLQKQSGWTCKIKEVTK